MIGGRILIFKYSYQNSERLIPTIARNLSAVNRIIEKVESTGMVSDVHTNCTLQ